MGGIIMEPFSLEEYFNNPSRKVVTRDGKNVRIICAEWSTDNDGIVVIIQKDGRYNLLSENNINDLFFASKKHTDYINLYHNEFGYFLGDNEYRTEELAKKVAAGDKEYITTIKAEWEE